MNIAPSVFDGLLDSLAGQFYKIRSAVCAGEDFGNRTPRAAKDFFSVTIIKETLSKNLDVLGVLVDDSGYIPGKKSFTFVIYIDVDKIEGKMLPVSFSLIIAHELCHLAYYYELFLSLGADTTSMVLDAFRHTVMGTLEGAVTKEKDSARKTVIDEHNVAELIYSFGKYSNSHFAKKNKTSLDYRELFYHFLERLKFSEELEKLKA
jgi:hypothetical protein